MSDTMELRKKAGAITFRSPDAELNEGFVWAKRQALEYAHFGEDAVGLWYEAALPGREAFCIRDVMHHSAGAAALGLAPHTKNMLLRFAENIAPSRDWCTYWEITKDNKPAKEDYDNDRDFWYNLPANFDIIDACWRMYLWTGDRDYLAHPVLREFFRLTLTEYTTTWDKDGDGILDYNPAYGRRGLATYNEAGIQPLAGGDMVGAQIAAYRAYSRMAELAGRNEEKESFAAKAQELEESYDRLWWSEEHGRFSGAMRQDRTFVTKYNAEGTFLPLYFGAVADPGKLRRALEDVGVNLVENVEGKTYLPDIFYRYGMIEDAYRELKELVAPSLDRREYPEVSYCAVGAVATGLMGISGDGNDGLATQPKLAASLEWAELTEVPALGRTIAVRHYGNDKTALTLQEGEALFWKASFPFRTDVLFHNGKAVPAQTVATELGDAISFITVEVNEGETHVVTLSAE
ncbi:MGH1-like glycoside hydrolase domain-containing protein [Paenibacillus macerans]|uniref:alpha-L-rhamnosidase-related protein n=1 Tax=Paenibacillus macerans TaxID=44252 RepID=UPI003D3175CA